MSASKTVQCINCGKQRRCLLICAFTPTPADLEGQDLTLVSNGMRFDEALRVAICRKCLLLPLSPLAAYIAGSL